MKSKPLAIFLQILGLGLAALSGLVLLGLYAFPHIHRLGQGLLGRLEEACGCTDHFAFFDHPIIYSFFLLVAAGFISLAGLSSYRILKLARDTRKFSRRLTALKKDRLSSKLETAVQATGLKGKVIETGGPEATIFCYGYFHPRICISANIVRKLNGPELRAVLWHEKHHLRSYEPLRILVVLMTKKIFFFIPGLKMLAEKYSLYAELEADKAAALERDGKAPLARALYEILGWQKFKVIPGLGISFFSPVSERINQLADDDYSPKIKVANKRTAGQACLVVMVFSLLAFSLYKSAGTAQADNGGYCPHMEASFTRVCPMMASDSAPPEQGAQAMLCQP